MKIIIFFTISYQPTEQQMLLNRLRMVCLIIYHQKQYQTRFLSLVAIVFTSDERVSQLICHNGIQYTCLRTRQPAVYVLTNRTNTVHNMPYFIQLQISRPIKTKCYHFNFILYQRYGIYDFHKSGSSICFLLPRYQCCIYSNRFEQAISKWLIYETMQHKQSLSKT